MMLFNGKINSIEFSHCLMYGSMFKDDGFIWMEYFQEVVTYSIYCRLKHRDFKGINYCLNDFVPSFLWDKLNFLEGSFQPFLIGGMLHIGLVISCDVVFALESIHILVATNNYLHANTGFRCIWGSFHTYKISDWKTNLSDWKAK